MDFLIKLDIDAGISSFKEFTDGANELPYIQFSGNNSMPYSKIEAGELIWYIVGDLIIPVDERSRKEEFLKETLSDFYCEKIRQLKGTFYEDILQKRREEGLLGKKVLGKEGFDYDIRFRSSCLIPHGSNYCLFRKANIPE